VTEEGLKKLYEVRFSQAELERKNLIWKMMCQHYFQKLIRSDAIVLDMACGQGEFIRNIEAAGKIAVDINDSVERNLPGDIRFIRAPADAMTPVASESVDVCFASNFFEHLESKAVMDAVLLEGYRVLKPGGKFICMQPNIRYAPDRYWDFYDHVLPLSHLSAAEAFGKNGYLVEQVVPRFVPFSTKSAFPTHPLLVRLYLALPIAWPLLGGQFVIVARKPEAGNQEPRGGGARVATS
jgi:ubiquinone/menaquinone biosynthesis C-methylase UbiE